MSIYKISNEFEKSVNFFPDKKRIAFLKNNLYNDYEDSPAVEIQYNSGAKKVIHYKDNKIHNENGPAITTYDQVGTVIKEEFYIEDNYYPDEEIMQGLLDNIGKKGYNKLPDEDKLKLDKLNLLEPLN